MTLFMCLITAYKAPAQTGAAVNMDEIQPLQIGDTIPEELWHLPLQVVNHPEGKETITLNDYRGKLILIDLLSFGCSSCIQALPKIDSIQRLFPNNLFVLLSQRAERDQAVHFFSKNHYAQGTGLCTTVGDRLLPEYFPHRLISHVVWISPSGVLYSTTGTDLILSENIQHLLNGGKPNWLPKWESPILDYNRPLFAINVQGDHQIRTPAQYTVFGGYIEGATSRFSHIKDTAAGLSHHRLINLPLYHFILACFGEHPQMFPANHVQWHVGSENRYRFIPSDTIPQSVWEREHLYSYEATIPINAPDMEWRLLLKQDLQRFFPGLKFSMREDTVSCLFLVNYNGDRKTNDHWGGRATSSTASWVAAFNQRLPIPVIDASENIETTAIPYELFDEVNNVEQARSLLQKVGYDLQPGKRKLMQLFISDTSYTFNQDEKN